MRQSTYLGAVFLLSHSFRSTISVLSLQISCDTTADNCREGTVCLETGYCSNPFHHGGCLDNMKRRKKFRHEYFRVCTSLDDDDSVSNGDCQVPEATWNYTEIRFMGNNWESVVFVTWIMQIVLTEVLGVPTSVDTNDSVKVIDFYDKHDRFDFGDGYDWDAMRRASEYMDCRKIEQPENKSDYSSCAHVSMEVWEGQFGNLRDLQKESVIEKPTAMGILGAGLVYPVTYR
jgi:hypothetical protein